MVTNSWDAASFTWVSNSRAPSRKETPGRGMAAMMARRGEARRGESTTGNNGNAKSTR